MSDDLVTWLRRQIRLRLTLATIAPVVDFQGNEPAPPAPAYLQYVDGVPWHEFTRDGLIRHLEASGVLVTSERPEAWFGDWPTDDLKPLMTGDPQDATARCEAELAILDEHATEVRPTVCGVPGQLSYWCKNCHVPRDQAGGTWCRTVRLLASGYQHRPGYRAEWRP